MKPRNNHQQNYKSFTIFFYFQAREKFYTPFLLFGQESENPEPEEGESQQQIGRMLPFLYDLSNFVSRGSFYFFYVYLDNKISHTFSYSLCCCSKLYESISIIIQCKRKIIPKFI